MSTNQCDGCMAGKPLVKLVNGEFVEAPDGYCHVMGSLEPGRYPDLMGCERKRYEDYVVPTDEEILQSLTGIRLEGGDVRDPTKGHLAADPQPNCSCDQRGRNVSCPRCS